MLYSSALWQEIFWYSFAAWGLFELWVFSRDLRAAKGQKQDRGSIFAVAFSIWLALSINFTLPFYVRFARIYPPSLPLFVGGIALIWLGMALRLWSILALGRFFRTSVFMLSDHRLVTAGPYRLLRHPAYSGALLTIAGIGIARQNWLCALLGVAAASAGFAYRITVEEKALSEHFGAAYAARRQQSWGLIPFVW